MRSDAGARSPACVARRPRAGGVLGGAGDAASPAPSATASATPDGGSAGPAGGTKMAPGLYDLEDGTVVAVGTVEYRDLEGGFWAVIGGTEAEGDAGKVVAVIANGDEFADQFRGERGPLVRGLRRAGRRRVHPHGRPGDHRDAASCSPPRAGRPSSAASGARRAPRVGQAAPTRIRRPEFGGAAREAGTTL